MDQSETIAGAVAARAHDDTIGLICGDLRLTHAEVVDRAAQRAAWLLSNRSPGPFHVAVMLDNVPEFIYWLEAAALVGAVIVGANPTHRGDELARDLSHTECQLLITDTTSFPLVDGLVIGDVIGTVAPANPHVFLVDAPNASTALSPHEGTTAADVLNPDVTPETLGYLLFTSGTSGAPKACLCSQGRLARIGAIVAQMYALTPDDVCYLSMPLFHSNALMAGWGPALMAGATFALPSSGRFSASGFLPDVRAAGATYFNYVGKPLAYILATPERPDDADNPLIRAFGNEGSADDVARFAERFDVTVTDAYGSTEGGATVARTPDTPPGALGRAPEGTVVLSTDTGEECPPARFDERGRILNAEEAIGELVSKAGGAGFEGYWRNDDAQSARLREGWYWTGDLAYRDEVGFFYFAGRDHDWLRVDGENFASAPIERILQRHPDVVLAAVYAVPDPVVGDQVMAAVQVRPGIDSLDPDVLASFLAEQGDLGTKWAPRFVRMTPALPITATNKVLKRALRAERWNCADPVLWQPSKGSGFEVLQPEEAAALEAAVADRVI
ncbi:MAG TPA: AMP-binding protein [Acidimicrobiales bacterium]|jgi:fatty-acyl-CoA synthase|nr:AMP-binding protein [Acidimicrobiales bacterium]